MNIIVKCRENQFKQKATWFCTDKDGNELSRMTGNKFIFEGWFQTDVTQDGVCDFNATTTTLAEEKPKICVTGFEPDCFENVSEYPVSKCSLRWDSDLTNSNTTFEAFNCLNLLKERESSVAAPIKMMSNIRIT